MEAGALEEFTAQVEAAVEAAVEAFEASVGWLERSGAWTRMGKVSMTSRGTPAPLQGVGGGW
jgi:hypothetical protein